MRVLVLLQSIGDVFVLYEFCEPGFRNNDQKWASATNRTIKQTYQRTRPTKGYIIWQTNRPFSHPCHDISVYVQVACMVVVELEYWFESWRMNTQSINWSMIQHYEMLQIYLINRINRCYTCSPVRINTITRINDYVTWLQIGYECTTNTLLSSECTKSTLRICCKCTMNACYECATNALSNTLRMCYEYNTNPRWIVPIVSVYWQWIHYEYTANTSISHAHTFIYHYHSYDEEWRIKWHRNDRGMTHVTDIVNIGAPIIR